MEMYSLRHEISLCTPSRSNRVLRNPLNRNLMKKMIGRGITYCILAVAMSITMYAQSIPDTTPVPFYDPNDRPALWVTLDDNTTMVYLLNQVGDSTPPIQVAAGFDFLMSYDSICLVSYAVSEFRHNGNRLRLSKWKDNTFANAHPSILTANSGTISFIISSGDTISVYREFSWINPQTRIQDTTNYYALDTLEYIIELVRLSDSTIVARLDSLGVLPNTSTGKPILYGNQPVMANVHYVVPNSLHAQNVFLRIRPKHNGPGKYWFSRKDEITSNISNRLRDSVWQEFLALMGVSFNKYYLPNVAQSPNKADKQLIVFQNYDNVTINISCHNHESLTSVCIYDAQGNRIFIPYMSTTCNNNTINYNISESGIYFIVLFQNGKLIDIEKISIN